MLRADTTIEESFGRGATAGQAPGNAARALEPGEAKQRHRLLSLLGEAQRTPLPFDLHNFAKTVGSELEAAAASRGLRSGVFIGTSCPRHVRGEERRLGTLLRSLVRDALRRNSSGSVKLHVDASESETGVILRFDITAVTTAFDAADRAAPNSPGGLDQVLAKRLVEQMGGEFGFEEVPGKGSSVWFTVPAELAPRPTLAPEPTSKLRGHVLAVVHNGLAQRLITSYLHEFGVGCDVVKNGAEALKRLSAGAYDLVLLDMATPELDGMQTAEKIRRLQSPAAEIPVIALIWHATKENREEYLAAGLDGYVAKPIRGRELHSALAAHLTPEDAEREPAANGAAAIESAP